jgi:predicted PurR-regulated permease PerM
MEVADSATAQPGANSRTRRLFALLLVVIFLVLFMALVAPFFEALVLAAVFSGLLYPIFARLRRSLRNATVASLATTLLAFVVVVLPLTVLVGVLTREAARVSEVVAPWVDGKNDVRELSSVVPQWVPYRSQVLERTGQVVSQIGTFAVDRLTRATQSTVIFLLNLFVLLYAMFFFFIRGPRLLAFLSDYTPLSNDDKHVIAKKGLEITRATLKSILVIGSMQGALGGIGFAVAGIDSAVFWGIVMAVASALPSVGTALVWVPATIALFLQGDTTAALALAAWCALVVSSLDNIVRPRLVGTDAKMPDLVVLLSTLGGIGMFGVSGIIIGPLLAGLFLTSLDIFTATFERELKDGAGTPAVVDANGAPTGADANRNGRVEVQQVAE